MKKFCKDPLSNIIDQGIKRDIQITLENNCLRAAVILIYSGIDTMAYLSSPVTRKKAVRDDFIKWANYYIKFPCKEQLTGKDIYGARCAMLHTYSVESDLSRQGQCRRVTYTDKGVPEIRYVKDVIKNVVENSITISIKGLKEAFFKGIDESLIDIYKNGTKAKIADKRLNKLVKIFPLNK